MTNTLKTTALLAALTALLIVIGDVLGGRGGMLLFFGFAIVLNMGAYWFSGDIALKMAGAREVTPQEAPELHQLVEEQQPSPIYPSRAWRSSTARRRTLSPRVAMPTTLLWP